MLMRDECAVCILNQIIRAGKYMDLNERKSNMIFKKVLKEVYETDYSGLTPPVFSGKVYASFSSLAGDIDPYKKLKKEQNDLVLNNIDLFRRLIDNSEDSLLMSFLYSLHGNIIDYGGTEIFDTNKIFERPDDTQLAINDYQVIKGRLSKAKSLLIIADNAGEAVFDMLLIERIVSKYPKIDIKYGVKSGPAINDVTKKDAEYIGIGRVAEIVETGSDYAGTMISLASPDFVDIYNNSDIVISKGQGNFETLEIERSKGIFFIFKVKCSIVSEHSGLPVNSLVLGYLSSMNMSPVP